MLERARAAGVEALLAIGSGTSPVERIDSAIPFAEQHDWIYATVGVHPHDASVATEEHFAQLEELGRHPRVIAWGEMGLDYHYENSPRDVQARVFDGNSSRREQRNVLSSIAATRGTIVWRSSKVIGKRAASAEFFIASPARSKRRAADLI